MKVSSKATQLEISGQPPHGSEPSGQLRLVVTDESEALRRLADNASHDVNNMLQTLISGARLIARKPDDPESVRRLAGLLENAATRGSVAVDLLLDVAHAPAMRPERNSFGVLAETLRGMLAEALGGTVELRLEVVVDRPSVDQPCNGAVMHQSLTIRASEKPVIAPKSGRILIVSDDEALRALLAEYLPGSGYDVLQAERSDVALELLTAGEKADLLVSDYSMRGMDGLALIGAVHRLQPSLPAILLGGSPVAPGAGGTGPDTFTFMRKPVGAAELVDRIAVLLAARTTG